jgi:two-component system, NarL family, response regulator LiaR
MSETTSIRVMIVDDHEMIRSSLSIFLKAFDDLELVGDIGSGEEALRLVPLVQPDVVLMDLLMPGMDGVETLQAIHRADPDIQVIGLSSFCTEELVQRAIEAGAVGCLMKNTSIDELAKAIRDAKKGKPVLVP